MVYTNLEASNAGKHGMFESSNLKSSIVGNIYDLVFTADIDNGVGVAVGAYKNDGLQLRSGAVAATTDVIAVTGTPALIKDAFTKAQEQPYNFYNKKGDAVKAYEVVKDDIFAVAKYQFTTASADYLVVGSYVAVDGNGKWVATAGTGSAPTAAFVGKIHSFAKSTDGTNDMVRILCVKNATA